MNTKEINGKHYIDAKVVMLATGDKSPLVLNNIENGLFLVGGTGILAKHRMGDCTNQHLYITSNDEIKKGDWFLLIGNNGKKDYKTLLQCHSVAGDMIYTKCYPHFSTVSWNKKQCFKILRTTNKSTNINIGFPNEIIKEFKLNLPEPSKEFVQSFIESYNKGEAITDVLVEVECGQCTEFGYVNSCRTSCNGKFFQLKISNDNTVNVVNKNESWDDIKVKLYVGEKTEDDNIDFFIPLPTATSGAE